MKDCVWRRSEWEEAGFLRAWVRYGLLSEDLAVTGKAKCARQGTESRMTKNASERRRNRDALPEFLKYFVTANNLTCNKRTGVMRLRLLRFSVHANYHS